MKLPSMLEKFLPKNTSEKEIFSSIVLTQEYAAATLWEMGEKGVPHVLASDSKPCAEDSWEARLDAVDESLANVEDAVGTTKYSKVVLGLPTEYLTEDGEIRKEIRTHIKSLTKELDLTPIGFVSLAQAILYRMKKEEGVPPSVILLNVTKKSITVSLYKVGTLIGEIVKERAEDTAITFEEALKEFKDLEVLPARILLYGHDEKSLEDVKTELLRYPWTTRVNFLHFPKIEIIPPVDVAAAVSLAGASELSHEVGAEEEQTVEEVEEIKEEESNVVAVDPENLGFKKNVDVLEEAMPAGRQVEVPKRRFTVPKLPAFDYSLLKDKFKIKGYGPVIGIVVGILLLIGLLYWFVPHATVTVFTLPKALSATETIMIDPAATVVDGEKKIIPGAAQEKSVSGTKTIPVTGKKNIGDPARGSVTIYNKQTNEKTFTKGTILISGSLQFTLDSDVHIASASESVGSITFGKATGAITASQIGTDSNLAAAAEFRFKDVDAGVAIARNDSVLTGGTSKSVTVVSRADQDAFVKAVSADLVDKAKQDLASSVTGSTKLIDETITTAVTQKTFNQELDQEAAELSGNATVTVSGTSYNGDDVQTLMKAMITAEIPSGYALAEGRTKVTLENVKVAKDGKVTAKATIVSDATPTLDVGVLRKNLTGKTVTAAQEYMRGITGVAAVEIRFGLSFSRSRLPINAKNITVGLAIQ